MGSLTQRQYSDHLFKQTKGIKENPREIQYLRWVNYKCGAFYRRKLLYKTNYEDTFESYEAKELVKIFKDFFTGKNEMQISKYYQIKV